MRFDIQLSFGSLPVRVQSERSLPLALSLRRVLNAASALRFFSRVAATALALCLCFTIAASAAGPSFDCSKAKQADERAICANADLAALELRASNEFQSVRDNVDAKRSRQIAQQFLSQRHGCGEDAACIQRVLSNAIQAYGQMRAENAPAVQAAPSSGEITKAGGNLSEVAQADLSGSASDSVAVFVCEISHVVDTSLNIDAHYCRKEDDTSVSETQDGCQVGPFPKSNFRETDLAYVFDSGPIKEDNFIRLQRMTINRQTRAYEYVDSLENPDNGKSGYKRETGYCVLRTTKRQF